jgi:hypothetical protein
LLGVLCNIGIVRPIAKTTAMQEINHRKVCGEGKVFGRNTRYCTSRFSAELWKVTSCSETSEVIRGWSLLPLLWFLEHPKAVALNSDNAAAKNNLLPRRRLSRGPLIIPARFEFVEGGTRGRQLLSG